MLHARVAEYDPAWCDELYGRREIFEAYNKGLSLVPTDDLPWFRVASGGAASVLAETPPAGGRLEPRIDRAAGRVQMLAVWWEDGFEPRRTEGFVDAMRDALRAYLRFGGASRIEWAPELTMEKRLLVTRL